MPNGNGNVSGEVLSNGNGHYCPPSNGLVLNGVRKWNLPPPQQEKRKRSPFSLGLSGISSSAATPNNSHYNKNHTLSNGGCCNKATSGGHLSLSPLVRKRSESESEYSPQTRNDVKLRLKMRSPAEAFDVLAASEARKRTWKRLRVMRELEEFSGGLAAKSKAKKKHKQR
jgi:hypothetical protein